MFLINISPKEAEGRLREIKHQQFLNSISTKWTVDKERSIRPQSICWLFVWAANADPKWQHWANELRTIFNEVMPITYERFAKQVGKEQAEVLLARKSDVAVYDAISKLVGKIGPHETLNKELSQIAARVADGGYFDPLDLTDHRDRQLREIVQRRGQPEFRIKLISAYQGRCAVTGSDAVDALEAAHIIPYKGVKSQHVTNGLLLRADIHTLFDLNLLGIEPPTLKVVLSPKLLKTCLKEFGGRKLALPDDAHQHLGKEALGERWMQFRARHSSCVSSSPEVESDAIHASR